MIGFALFFVGLVGVYALNPFGTATYDPRARVLGFIVYRITSTSMAPTLKPGQFVWVTTHALRFDPPKAGDLIAFRYPTEPTSVIIGRIIGQGGDRVAIDDGEVTVNGRPIVEPYLERQTSTSANGDIHNPRVLKAFPSHWRRLGPTSA